MPGTLYIVATPIGNLSDLTTRAQQVLGMVGTVAAEDSRHARTLLEQTSFSGKIVTYHDFSDDRQLGQLIELLRNEADVALISDAGTPLISDPGYKLVRQAREEGLPVIPIPGPSALTAAISVAGLPTDRFSFEGFLPSKVTARRKRIYNLVNDSRTLIFYESPHRIVDCVQDLKELLGTERNVFLAREMTKKFEQHFSGTLSKCHSWLQEDDNHTKGEFVVIVAGASEEAISAQLQVSAMQLVTDLRKDLPLKRAVALAAQLTGARKNELYTAALAAEQAGSES